MKYGLSRRRLLQGLGLGAGLAPLLPILNASGQTAGAGPKRLLLLYTPDGTPSDGHSEWVDWRPTGTETDFTLHEIHTPLDAHKSKMVIPAGLEQSMVNSTGDKHGEGMIGMWTGANITGDGGWATGPSIDQVVAQAHGAACPYQTAPSDPVQETRFRTLELGVDVGRVATTNRNIFRGNNDPINPEEDPGRAFQTIFDGVSSSVGEPMVDHAAEHRRAESLALLDLDRSMLNKIRTKVGRHDYDKIDRHLESLLAVEQGLSAPSSGASAACSVPSINGGSSFPDQVKAMMDITAMTLACDLTRVMSLQLSHGFSGVRHGEWAPGASDTPHHVLSHDGAVTNRAEKLVAIDKWYSTQVAYLLDLLDSIPEGDGTVLDNTLIVWGRELGTTRHLQINYPMLLFGGAAGALQTGRNLNVEGESHVKVLVSIGQLMGLEMNSFGNLMPNSGGLSVLTG